MTEGKHEKNPNQFGEHRNLNSDLSEYEFSVMNFDRRYAQYIQNFIIDRTSQSTGAGIRAYNFNRRNDGTLRIREVPLVHAACDVIAITYTQSLHAINGL